jgi:hypothetical protein
MAAILHNFSKELFFQGEVALMNGIQFFVFELTKQVLDEVLEKHQPSHLLLDSSYCNFFLYLVSTPDFKRLRP